MRLYQIVLAAALLLAASVPAVAMPKPMLVLVGAEQYQAGGKTFTRYKLSVTNSSMFTADLFAAAPALPPCGLNANSSRSWVDIFWGPTRLYGFCALGTPSGLTSLWFAVEQGKTPPPRVYIKITDRQTNTSVVSNEVKIN